MTQGWFQSIRTPEGCILRRKETLEYTTAYNIYDVELYENQDGTYYAVGVPREGKFIVYGSPIVETALTAVQTVIDKIKREGLEQQGTVASTE